MFEGRPLFEKFQDKCKSDDRLNHIIREQLKQVRCLHRSKAELLLLPSHSCPFDERRLMLKTSHLCSVRVPSQRVSFRTKRRWDWTSRPQSHAKQLVKEQSQANGKGIGLMIGKSVFDAVILRMTNSRNSIIQVISNSSHLAPNSLIGTRNHP